MISAKSLWGIRGRLGAQYNSMLSLSIAINSFADYMNSLFKMRLRYLHDIFH